MRSTLFFVLLLSMPCFASDPVTAKVEEILSYNNSDFVFIKVSPKPQNKPACATNEYDYSFHMKPSQGNSIYSTILSAKYADKELTFLGIGSCDPFQTNSEMLHAVILK